MITGLVLIKLNPGEEKATLAEVKRITGVKNLTGTFGPWDAIATVEGKDLETLASVVVGKVRAIRGVVNTETLIAVKI